ncbi:hypothetical protein LZL87_011731 [Fusarium oxysporum]|nr:hypothetical protein LZL87_011731 [Fusarium oxysporum]
MKTVLSSLFCFGISSPQFPPGDWNNGHVVQDLATGEPSFVKTKMVQFPGALKKLHEFGIKMGDTNKFNFLVRDGHDVVIADLETAKQGRSQDELEEEMKGLKASLEDTSFLGGK